MVGHFLEGQVDGKFLETRKNDAWKKRGSGGLEWEERRHCLPEVKKRTDKTWCFFAIQ